MNCQFVSLSFQVIIQPVNQHLLSIYLIEGNGENTKGKDKFPELNDKLSWKSESVLRIPEYK